MGATWLLTRIALLLYLFLKEKANNLLMSEHRVSNNNVIIVLDRIVTHSANHSVIFPISSCHSIYPANIGYQLTI